MITIRVALLCSVAIGVGGCHQPTPSTSNASAPLAAEHRELSAVEIYDLQEKCTHDAREWYKQNYPDAEPMPVQGGGTIVDAPAGYENHYSSSQNRCYALLHKWFSESGVKNAPVDFIQSNLLWDVNENVQLGAFIVRDLKEITACNVNGVQCKTKEEWTKLAQPYLGN